MTTGMHRTRCFGSILKPCRFGDRQSIHIRSKADRTPAGLPAPTDHRDNASLTKALNDLVTAKAFEPLGHKPRRACLFKSQLGVGVKIPPPRRNLSAQI